MKQNGGFTPAGRATDPDALEPNAHELVKLPKRRRSRRRAGHGLGLLLIMAIAAGLIGTYMAWSRDNGAAPVLPILTPTPTPGPQPGDVLGQDNVKAYNVADTTALAKQNYGATAPAIATGITKVTFRYRSLLPDGKEITLYGRAYLPESPKKNLPVFAFATGTTGIGDQCSPSLEQPAKANWANYDSHMAMYASQGYAAVTPDYEGMRDTARIHHYMVGELEGRALLDAVRALRNLTEAKGRLADDVFLAGYSQGGHAAFWADKIAASYAPDVKPKGVVGFGPVMSVKQTLADITRGANINWFGPYVLFSYRDYYRTDYGTMLQQRWDDNLAADVQGHCIDTVLPFWGHTPANIYTPEFLQALSANQLAESYPALSRDLDRNDVGASNTPSAKRINQGDRDNVILPAQQQVSVPLLCQSSRGPVQLVPYNATHYDTMLHSFKDTLAWMDQLRRGEKPATTCR